MIRGTVVVGGSLAGTRLAGALRAAGHDGTITVVGAEPPYDRPPLSKEHLTGDTPAEPTLPSPDAELITGVTAVALDRTARTVRLSDGRILGWDRLAITTGAAARAWPGPAPDGVLRLRGLDDARRLRSALTTPGARVVVIGGGVLGSEIAAAAAVRGVPATLVAAGPAPMAGVLGERTGAFLATALRATGVVLRAGETVRGFVAEDGRLTGVRLDGEVLPATVAVVAVGAVPHTGWLDGAGLTLTDDGALSCDAAGRVRTPDGPAPDIVAAGDVAAWPHPLAGDRPVHLGHWASAVHQAGVAARTLLGLDAGGPAPVPYFWSDLPGLKLRAVGLPRLADEVRVLQDDPAARRFEAVHLRDGMLVGAVTINRAGRLAGHQAALRLAIDGLAPAHP